MIRKFKYFFKSKKDIQEQEQETQEELDDKLFTSIDTSDYNTFTTVIKNGADINNVRPDGSGRKGYTKTPLISIIYQWRGSAREQFRFLKFLFENKVNLFDNIGVTPFGSFEIDIYKEIKNNCLYSEPIIHCLLENYPDYMKERNFRKDVNSYNL